jgi:hypothetical protein
MKKTILYTLSIALSLNAMSQDKNKGTSDTIRLNKLEVVKEQLETLKAQLTEGLVGAAKRVATQKSKEYQDLLAQRKKLESEANKIVSIEDAITDAEDIAVFTAWTSDNLPSFITLEDIKTLTDNLKAGGVRVGAFVLNKVCKFIWFADTKDSLIRNLRAGKIS